jgi:cytoskeletal protein CcmA (bactofilin family)/Zn finger protein HypA/HybF involved in hydrogenase expression
VAAKGRIEVQCPHCGNIQLEPELAKSTYCRKCSGYIQLDKGHRTGPPQQELQKHSGVLQKLEGFLGVQRTVVARCFECIGKREVPKSATSTICPQCGAYIDLRDYRIVGNYSRSIRTRGRLFLTNKGDLNSNRVICEEADIQGLMRGSLICNGEVRIRLKGKLSGSIEAKKVLIDRRSEVEFVRPLRGELVEIEGVVAGRITASGKVVIQKSGRLTGAVFARAFTVEKGGVFLGELSIGKVELTQGELLDSAAPRENQPGNKDSGENFSLASA